MPRRWPQGASGSHPQFDAATAARFSTLDTHIIRRFTGPLMDVFHETLVTTLRVGAGHLVLRGSNEASLGNEQDDGHARSDEVEPCPGNLCAVGHWMPGQRSFCG